MNTLTKRLLAFVIGLSMITLGGTVLARDSVRLTSPVSSQPKQILREPIKPVAEKQWLGYAWNQNSDPRRVTLKIRDEVHAYLYKGSLRADVKDSAMLEALETINRRVQEAGGRLKPGLSVKAEVLRKRRIEAQRNTATPLADLTQYFRIQLPDNADTKSLIEALQRTAYVENAYADRRPAPLPGDIEPVTPSFTAEQGYASAAPEGIDTDYVHYETLISAADTTITDIELCWTLTHEDLSNVSADPAIQIGPDPTSELDPLSDDCSHGTAVLGMLAADDDGYGITGLVPEATYRVSTTLPQQTEYGIRDALATVALGPDATLLAGDVILVERQIKGPHSSQDDDRCYGCLPVEYDDFTYNLIRNITALGIHVVEAGANG